MAPSLLSVFLPIKAKYDAFASISRYLMVKLLESLCLTKGGHQVHIASSLFFLACKDEESTDMRMDNVRGDLKSLKSFPIQDIMELP